jgi:hypothetical protein
MFLDCCDKVFISYLLDSTSKSQCDIQVDHLHVSGRGSCDSRSCLKARQGEIGPTRPLHKQDNGDPQLVDVSLDLR